MKDINDNKTLELIENDKLCERCNIKKVDSEYLKKCSSCNYSEFKIESFITCLSDFVYSNITMQDLRVYLNIIMYCSDQGDVLKFRINQKELADKTRIKTSNLNRSIKNLITEELLIKIDKNLYILKFDKHVII